MAMTMKSTNLNVFGSETTQFYAHKNKCFQSRRFKWHEKNKT